MRQVKKRQTGRQKSSFFPCQGRQRAVYSKLIQYRRVCSVTKKGSIMASKAEKFYPPYPGQEPYIHLCFSDRDERKVRPLLRRLLLRGCRVWYSMGQARDRSALTERNRRMLAAGLTVLYLTEAARRDTELKNKLLVCQRMGQPILVLNTDAGDSGLSLGLTGESSAAVLGGNAADTCDAILHGRGFSQAFMGDPQPVYDRRILRRFTVLLLLLSLLLGVGYGAYIYLHPPVMDPPEETVVLPADTVILKDQALREAVRETIGGGAITEEAVRGLKTLSLSRLPDGLEDLSLLPDLSTLILSEAAAQGAPQLPELYDRYTLIVAGGEAP